MFAPVLSPPRKRDSVLVFDEPPWHLICSRSPAKSVFHSCFTLWCFVYGGSGFDQCTFHDTVLPFLRHHGVRTFPGKNIPTNGFVVVHRLELKGCNKHFRVLPQNRCHSCFPCFRYPVISTLLLSGNEIMFPITPRYLLSHSLVISPLPRGTEIPIQFPIGLSAILSPLFFI